MQQNYFGKVLITVDVIVPSESVVVMTSPDFTSLLHLIALPLIRVMLNPILSMRCGLALFIFTFATSMRLFSLLIIVGVIMLNLCARDPMRNIPSVSRCVLSVTAVLSNRVSCSSALDVKFEHISGILFIIIFKWFCSLIRHVAALFNMSL